MAQPTIFQKSCNVCKKVRPIDEFYAHKTASGYHPSCKDCVRARSNAWRKQAVADGRYRLTKARYRKSTGGQASIRKYEMKESTKEKRKAASTAWYTRNRERLGIKPRSRMTEEQRAMSRRNSTLKRKYKITGTKYSELFKKQNGLCAICGNPPPPTSRRKEFRILAVDHDHSNGQVRGLLCYKCNIGIGLLNDCPKVVQSALRYLLDAPTINLDAKLALPVAPDSVAQYPTHAAAFAP